MTPCGHCGAAVMQKQSAINRALRLGAPLYCGLRCAGLARRLKNPPSEAERKAAKAAYDASRRKALADEIKTKKRDYFQRTYDPIKAREVRKVNMPRHVEYCRQPEYKAWKSKYDRQLRVREYGSFGEAYEVLLELEKEINAQASWYDRAIAKGYFKRSALNRRRELCRMKKSLQP